jgi:hypothetical protein
LPQPVANHYVAQGIGYWLRFQLRNDPWAELWLYTIGGSFNGIVEVTTD